MQNQNLPQFQFDITIHKDFLKHKIIQLFETLPGNKQLILSQRVLQLLKLSIENKVLLENGVKKTLQIETLYQIESDITQIFIIIPPKQDLIKKISKLIKTANGPNNIYQLVFWPQRNLIAKELLEQEGVLSSVEIMDFSFDLIPLDQDVLSLEMPDAFRDVVVEQDFSIYTHVADSINRIQLLMGNIPNIYCKGDGAKMVYDIIKVESSELDQDQDSQEVESLIIYDRSIDLITPMLTQLVYEGLVDEQFGINGNLVSLQKKIFGKEGQEGEQYQTVQMSLDKDPLIYNVRGLQPDKFQRQLQIQIKANSGQEAARIKAEQDSNLRHLNISGKIADNIRTISFYKMLSLEQGIINGDKSDKALDYIEAMIQSEIDLNKVVRLLTLRTLVDGGLKQKPYDYMRREIIHVYGFKTIAFLNNLQKAGMVYKSDPKQLFFKLQESFKLLNLNVRSDETDPKDPAYTYGGHYPLIARLTEKIFEKESWKPFKAQMQLINGFQLEPDRPARLNVPGKKPIVIVYMLGGVTYGEIAALRLLGKQFNKEIIICTTSLTNGTKLIQSLRERI
ncbi:unnamed protein product (macronuclear) [Paramecium tetraurelia]|uniref:Uncharacterized protein n=1 Tax=Paramecium tetraurelia TaxID=5888 RepID=A0DQ57_PARTE|nr:uncharacterized protein GSPATT00002574001 [Paramecium tetraurelia]CAK85174.1 unnamed protein product [Paramecium tetraurelia]|eukprot:XP_001452571.1 hypothetical protein (macronuclear) [Paramecium tetraurelia strain d4-2]